MSEYIDNILKCVYPNKQINNTLPTPKKKKLNKYYTKLTKDTKLILEVDNEEENNDEQKEELKTK